MTNAPIYYALVQARFNVVLQMDRHVPAIQDALRRLGFSDYQMAVMATLAPGVTAEQMPSLQQMVRHEFMDADRRSGFLLEPRALSFQTTEYETIEPFLENFIGALRVLNNEVGHLSFSERIGFRTLDAVCPRANESISDYLQPSVHGIFNRLPDRALVQSFSETRTLANDNTTLVSRAIILQQEHVGASYPADFSPVSLKQGERFANVQGLYAVIDTDCWHEGREDFSLPNIEAKVMLLHDEMRKSFEATITPMALSVWK